MKPFEIFRYCPRCGHAIEPGSNPLRCASCNFTWYFNPTVAAAAFIFDPHGRVIVIRRSKEPRKGYWTVPGGFIDIGETAEDGLAREVREEVGLEIDDLQFLCSEPNEYLFKDVTYPVCDLVFTARALYPDQAAALDGAEDFAWLLPSELKPEEIAFPSIRKAWEKITRQGFEP